MGRNIEQKIHELATQVADECGYELVDIGLFGGGSRTLLRVTLDKEGGINLSNCETFSRRLEALMDVEDPIGGSYTLEVSSPGLDRPLKSLDDFKKNVGKLARIITEEKVNNQNFFLGRIAGVNGTTIRLSVADGREEIILPFDAIAKARLEIELK
jgi:ribosome maturation factor RimP